MPGGGKKGEKGGGEEGNDEEDEDEEVLGVRGEGGGGMAPRVYLTARPELCCRLSLLPQKGG